MSNSTSKACQRCVNVVVVTPPCDGVEVLVHPRATSKRTTHGCHDADPRLALVAVLPKGPLLFLLSEIYVCNKVEVGPGGYAMIVKSNQDSSGPSFTTGDLTDRVLVGFGGEKVSGQCR